MIRLDTAGVSLCPTCFYEVGYLLGLLKYTKLDYQKILDIIKKERKIEPHTLEEKAEISKTTAYNVIKKFEVAGILKKQKNLWEYVGR